MIKHPEYSLQLCGSPLGWEAWRWYLVQASTFCQIRSYRGILLYQHAATWGLGLFCTFYVPFCTSPKCVSCITKCVCAWIIQVKCWCVHCGYLLAHSYMCVCLCWCVWAKLHAVYVDMFVCLCVSPSKYTGKIQIHKYKVGIYPRASSANSCESRRGSERSQEWEYSGHCGSFWVI